MTNDDLLSFASCENCGLAKDCKPVKPVLGYGNPNARLVLIGEAPDVDESIKGKPFVGISGKLLDSMLSMAGIDRKDVFVDNVVVCRTPRNRNLEKEEIESCKPRLQESLDRLVEKHVVLALGNYAAQAITGDQKKTAGSSIGQVDWDERLDAFLITGYHPATVLRNGDFFPDLYWTILKAKELLNRPKRELNYEKPQYIVSETAAEAIQTLRWIQYNVSTLGSDIETEGLDYFEDDILCIGFCWYDQDTKNLRRSTQQGNRHIYILPTELATLPEVRLELKNLLESREITFIWANGKFDVKFIKYHWLIHAHIDVDIVLLHYVFDERRGGIHGLKEQAKRFLEAPEWEKDIKQWIKSKKTKWSVIPRSALYGYQAYDLWYTRDLPSIIDKELAAEPPTREAYPCPRDLHDNLLIPAANALVDIEMRGAPIDVSVMNDLRDQFEREISELEFNIRELVKPLIGDQQASKFNPASAQQVCHVLYDVLGFAMKGGERTSKEEFLEDHRHNHPFIEELLRHRTLKKLYGTYVKGTEKRLSGLGRLHATFLLHGTITGRLACRNPNLQNIPRKSVVKKMFVASEGYDFVEVDYGQLEVRTAAWFSEDPVLLGDLKGDIHWNVAQGIFEKIIAEIVGISRRTTKVDKLVEAAEAESALPDNKDHYIAICSQYTILHEIIKRQASKPADDAKTLAKEILDHIRHMTKYVTFGILYGRGAKSLAKGELQCHPKEAQAYINNFHKRYHVLSAYMGKCHREAINDGWVETPTGRRRRFHLVTSKNKFEIERLSVNAPVQSFASDITLASLIELHRELTERSWGYILYTVHDALYFELKKEHTREAIRLIEHVMTTRISDSPVEFPVDIKIGKSWYDVQDYKETT